MNNRNQPCPCGSGKKYKKCCINKKMFWEDTEIRTQEYVKALEKDIVYSKKIGKEFGLLKDLVKEGD